MSDINEKSNVIPSGTSASVDGSSRSTNISALLEWFVSFPHRQEREQEEAGNQSRPLTKEDDKMDYEWMQ